ncbi:hypothetical protein LRC_00030 [Ligilactobacillus ruminis ATCC 27782]|uniref:Uncharacterized protein n=1 Tax=Ligilactobacillus ruminis (strain ATCC 27782 / RF3) TaxID=1069534 RepID=G2SPI3_LIGR2|nr:hypothetical protein LRC_00030 [Ligilactobacillus ruminis ATCC 27782]
MKLNGLEKKEHFLLALRRVNLCKKEKRPSQAAFQSFSKNQAVLTGVIN